MSRLAIFAAVCIVCAMAAPAEELPSWVYNSFDEWSAKWGLSFSTPTEREFRVSVFYKNLINIQETNARQSSYTLALNGFSAMTPAEFAETRLGYLPPVDLDRPSNMPEYNVSDVPTSVDWVKAGAVTDVKNQGACGSCWAFSTTGTLEGVYEIKTGTLASLSEQQLVDCSTKNYGCGGGYPSYALQYTQQYGTESETAYPYHAVDQQCQYDSSQVVYKNSGQVDLPPRDNVALQAATAAQPVSICLDAEQIMSYSGGIYDNQHCGTSIDHCILMTGYGVADDGTLYWTCKNSWGTTWGEHGYIRFLRYTGVKTAICGLNLMSQYPTY